jgi:hypothetical protein
MNMLDLPNKEPGARHHPKNFQAFKTSVFVKIVVAFSLFASVFINSEATALCLVAFSSKHRIHSVPR